MRPRVAPRRVKLLLDTNVWLWLQSEPGKVGDEMLDLLGDPANHLFLSSASAWEIAIKHGLGRLPLPQPPAAYVPDRMRRSGVTALTIGHDHALAVASLPPHHRDPFDRMLVAQARLEGLEIVTADETFAAYDVRLRWAGEGRLRDGGARSTRT